MLDKYTNGMKADDYLFPSRKGDRPITRVQAYRILNKAAEYCGYDLDIGTHSMRKTFGYHMYKGGADISELMTIFNHSSQSITLRYIGIERENLDGRISGLVL